MSAASLLPCLSPLSLLLHRLSAVDARSFGNGLRSGGASTLLDPVETPDGASAPRNLVSTVVDTTLGGAGAAATRGVCCG